MHRPAHTHQLQVRWWELILPSSDPLESKTYNSFFSPPHTPSIIVLVLALHARTMMQKRGDTLLMQIATTQEQNEHSNHWVQVLMSVLHVFFCQNFLLSWNVHLSLLTMFFFYFRRSPLTYFVMIDWVLPFVFFNMSSPAHVTIPAVHRLTLFACVCSWRRASINAVTQKEAAQRRHAKFTQLLTQSDEVRHWFQDAPCSLQKERESGRETGGMVMGWRE